MQNKLAAPRDLSRELEAHFQRMVQEHFQRLLRTAQMEWERRFDGHDPSDACVTVRISSPPALRSAA